MKNIIKCTDAMNKDGLATVRRNGMKGFVVEWMEDIWGNVWEKNGMNLMENWVQKRTKYIRPN
jgi:hypothetical protein